MKRDIKFHNSKFPDSLKTLDALNIHSPADVCRKL